VVGISQSGTGKQQGIDCAKEALSAIAALEHIGPGDFRSSVALVNALKVQSVFCSFIDEYGLVLQRIGDKRGGGYEYDVLSVLKQLWGHNWAYYNTPASAREKSKRIFAPAFSIFGLSVPDQFYGAVTFKRLQAVCLTGTSSFREEIVRHSKPERMAHGDFRPRSKRNSRGFIGRGQNHLRRRFWRSLPKMMTGHSIQRFGWVGVPGPLP
jgi:hypothetical protein